MPQGGDMIWIYLVVLAGFAAGAILYDRRRRGRSESGGAEVNHPAIERLDRVLKREGADVRAAPLQRSVTEREPTGGGITASSSWSVPHRASLARSEPGRELVEVGAEMASASVAAPAPAAVAVAYREAGTDRGMPAVGDAGLDGGSVQNREVAAAGSTAEGDPGAQTHRATWSLPDVLASPTKLLRALARSPETVGAPKATGGGRKPVRFADDAEFLPAALEILETPPSPTATWLMLGICAVFLTALIWAFVGKLDIHAVAMGKIQASGRTKVVQPLEAGRVAAILVESGQLVKKGDVLVELDPTETAADLEALRRELESVTGEAVRRNAAVLAARTLNEPAAPPLFPDLVGPRVRQRESDLLAAELSQLRSNIQGIKAQIAERQASKRRLAASIDARRRALGLSKERVGMREEIRTRGAGSRALTIDAELQYENFAITDASERGQLAEADASVNSLEARIMQAQDQFIAEQAQKASEADRRRDRLEQEIVKARSKRDRTQLRAPSAGLVQQIEVSTIGQVVASGQSLMSVVPVDEPLEVEAMIVNKDIGFITPGQRAVVKVEAFPFTRYGSIEARVVKVSSDAVEDRNATGMMDAASAARPQANSAPKTSPGQNLVFPAVLKLDRRTINIDGKEIPLTPGMAVTVEIKTGQRRAISYVLSPLSEVITTSAHER